MFVAVDKDSKGDVFLFKDALNIEEKIKEITTILVFCNDKK